MDTLWLALLPAALYFVIHLVEGDTIAPMLLARRFTLNPVAVILSLIFWYWMWGVPGAILAVPILARPAKLTVPGRRDRMRQAATVEVRLDQGKAASFGAARPGLPPFWLPTGRLRLNFVA